MDQVDRMGRACGNSGPRAGHGRDYAALAANVVFRPLPPNEFVAFDEPDYVKIVWTLHADPIGADASIFRTETRAVATNAAARARFRRYWSFLSPGIILIRWASLRPLKAAAERRARSAPLLRKRPPTETTRCVDECSCPHFFFLALPRRFSSGRAAGGTSAIEHVRERLVTRA
jgi:hypothetical protein